MKYNLFLFDLDDTLLDFKASERLSFYQTLKDLGINRDLDYLYEQYKVENALLWKLFEEAKTTKEHLKIERFKRVFAANEISLDPVVASQKYLEWLPQTVVLMDHASQVCVELAQYGEIGIITNGISEVQTKRIENSSLAPHINFVSVSEACGFAKPDVRFFEYTAEKARNFSKSRTIIIGDRLEADIQGAQNFGIDSCWFNPHLTPRPLHLKPDYEIRHLSELTPLLLSE